MMNGRRMIAAIRRLWIRRLYNSGDYNRALKHSMKQLSSSTNRDFALDIILRSYYNLGKWEKLVKFSSLHSELVSNSFVQKARAKIYLTSKGTSESPIINKNEVWNPETPLSNWYQEDSRIWFRFPDGWVFWEMPDDFELTNTHPSLLILSMNILLKPYKIRYDVDTSSSRPYGNNTGLSYSGGIDSTAAAMVLPEDTVLAYHERSFPSMLNHELAGRIFERWEQDFGRKVIRIPSNHEIIRSSVDLPIGFSSDFAAGVHLVLLSDYLDLKTISFGTPIDNTWLKKGATYRDFSATTYWIRWREYFNHAGLNLEFPINHISEAGAMKICMNSKFIDVLDSCLRGDGVSGCGRCWKCFNKNGPLGRKIEFNSHEIQTYLNRTPMPTAMHALWSIQSQRLEDKVPHWQHKLTESLEWWEEYYPPGLDLIGEPLRNHVEERTKQFLLPMQKPYPLEQVNLYPELAD